jgi:cystathionine beta-lyase
MMRCITQVLSQYICGWVWGVWQRQAFCSLSSIGLRYAAQDASTRRGCGAARVALVLHLHCRARQTAMTFNNATCSAAACLFSAVFKSTSASQVGRFCDGLQLFKLGYSWAGPMSLSAV